MGNEHRTPSATSERVKRLLRIGNSACPMDRYAKLTVEYFPHKKDERFEDGEWVFEVSYSGYGPERVKSGYGRTFEEALEEFKANAETYRLDDLKNRRERLQRDIDEMAWIEKEIASIEEGASSGTQ